MFGRDRRVRSVGLGFVATGYSPEPPVLRHIRESVASLERLEALERRIALSFASGTIGDTMGDVLTVDDLWRLVRKLPHDEQLKLARRVLRAASTADADAYRARPPTDDEFGSDARGLDWDAEGWESFDASR